MSPYGIHKHQKTSIALTDRQPGKAHSDLRPVSNIRRGLTPEWLHALGLRDDTTVTQEQGSVIYLVLRD